MRNLILTVFITCAATLAFANPTFLKAMPEDSVSAITEEPSLQKEAQTAASAAEKPAAEPKQETNIQEAKQEQADQEDTTQAQTNHTQTEKHYVKKISLKKKKQSVDDILKNDPDISLKEFLEEQKKIWQDEYLNNQASEAEAEEAAPPSAQDTLSLEQETTEQEAQEAITLNTEHKPSTALPKTGPKTAAPQKTAAKQEGAKKALKSPSKEANAAQDAPSDFLSHNAAQEAQPADEETPPAPWRNLLWGTLFVALIWGGIIVLSKYQ